MRARYNLAWVYQRQRDYPEALQVIAEGLRVLEEGPLRKDELGSGDVLSEQAQADSEPAGPA